MLFTCPSCGLAHELVADGLRTFLPSVSASTSRTVESVRPEHLAFWRLAVKVAQGAQPLEVPRSWRRATERTGAGSPWLYVPSFSKARWVVESLGVRLTRMQPCLSPASTTAAATTAGATAPFLPVLLTRRDAAALAEFVYLALAVDEGREVAQLNLRLEVEAEELVYVPAVSDPRCVHDANWRLLLREFD